MHLSVCVIHRLLSILDKRLPMNLCVLELRVHADQLETVSCSLLESTTLLILVCHQVLIWA